MDVFLIPAHTADQYELYYEAPEGVEDSEGAENAEGAGRVKRLVNGVRHRFSEMLREAEEWRLRRHEEEEATHEKVGMMTRLRRRVMGFVVERIAEQRLLWHMRTATCICAHIPADLTEFDAEQIIRRTLKKDLDHHFKWMWIDLLLLILVAPLVVVPGPNVPGFYFTFQVVGHFLSWRGAKHGLDGAKWTIKPNPALTELRPLLTTTEPHRIRRIQEVAARLRLQHLATYFEQVATTP
jgi:Mitochondrial K+-H+ exchange-related